MTDMTDKTNDKSAAESRLDSSTEDYAVQKQKEIKKSGLSPAELIQQVYSSFSAKNRERITTELIREIASKIDISSPETKSRTSNIRIHRLRIIGMKSLSGDQPEPINYDQIFSGGVNIILIPDNDVGKSSIQKTIKFALTGDDSDYDADVKAWIQRIWLNLYIDKTLFTIHLSREEQGLRGMIILGEDNSTVDEASSIANLLFVMTGIEEIKETLERFFFQKLGLHSHSWTQRDPSTKTGMGLRSTSWRTYFQGLLIPDSSDHYLVCDPQHATGNQDGLIISEFLGLSLTETLNALGVEASMTRRVEESTADEIRRSGEQIKLLTEQLQQFQLKISLLDTEQRRRREAYETEFPTERLSKLGSSIAEMLSEKEHVEQLREERNKRIRQARSQARHIREAIDLQLQFTGLSVSLCPNCDNAVTDESIEEEMESHSCRLCGKLAHAASPDDIAVMEIQAETYEDQVKRDEKAREEMNRHLAQLSRELDVISRERQSLQQIVQQGIAYVLPNSEEQALRSELYEQIGRVKAEISAAKQQAASHQTDNGEADIRHTVLKRVREVLQAEATRMNEEILVRLSFHTEEVVRRIGAQSITNVSCSALGKLSLKKNENQVFFSSIKNTGERLRVKIAFFVALMRLGREQGIGRHPGFLMIDQPASAEMVTEDVTAPASIFHDVNKKESEHLQIILFTARREFEIATEKTKIFGPQAPPFAF